MKKSAIFHI